MEKKETDISKNDITYCRFAIGYNDDINDIEAKLKNTFNL